MSSNEAIDINLEQLQKQINEAETYLKGLPTSPAGEFSENPGADDKTQRRNDSFSAASSDTKSYLRQSYPTASVPGIYASQEVGASSLKAAVRNSINVSDNTTTSRYSDPAERQNLIDRLLADHAQRGGATTVPAEEQHQTLHFQQASAPSNTAFHPPVNYFAGGSSKEDLSSVEPYTSGTGSNMQTSTPSGNQFTPSARYAAWELGNRLEDTDHVRVGETTGNIVENEEDDHDIGDTLFFASDLPAPPSAFTSGSTSGNGDPFMETTFFGRAPTPPDSRADSATTAAAAAFAGNVQQDESLMATVRFTKPLDPNLRGTSQSYGLEGYVSASDRMFSKTSPSSLRPTAAAAAKSNARDVNKSSDARLQGNQPLMMTDTYSLRGSSDSVGNTLSPTFVDDGMYDTLFTSTAAAANDVATATARSGGDERRGRSISTSDRTRGRSSSKENKSQSRSPGRERLAQQRHQSKRSGQQSLPVAMKTTAAMRARIKYNQEKHQRKQSNQQSSTFHRRSKESPGNVTSTGALYGFGRSESPPRGVHSSHQDGSSSGRALIASMGLNSTAATNHSISSPSKHFLKTRSGVQQEMDDEFKEQYTFQPTMFTREHRSPQTPDSLERPTLEQRSRSRSASRSRLAPEVPARYMQPRRGTTAAEANSKRQAMKPRLPVDPFAQAAKMQELHTSHRSREDERSRQIQMMQQLELDECTFQPKIARGSERILSQKEKLKQIDVDIDHYVNTGNWRDDSVERRPAASARNSSSNNNNNSRSRSRARSTSPTPRQPLHVSDQLYQDAQKRAAQQQWVKQQVERARQAQYTYQPVINPSTDAIVMTQEKEYKPIHERLADISKEKKEYMYRLKQSIEDEQAKLSSFQPKLNDRSEQLARRRRVTGWENDPLQPPRRRSESAQRLSGEREAELVMGFHADVGSRLLDAGRVLARRKQMLANKYDDAVAQSMEQVAISAGSRKIIRQKGLEGQGFEDRQEEYQSRQRMNLLNKQREDEERMQRYFKPDIDPKSAQIISNQQPERLLETAEMRSKRLSSDDFEAIEQRRRQRAAELYGSITFAPQIDPLSKALGRTASVQELADPSYYKQARERVRKQQEQREEKDCTFQPKINQLSKRLIENTDDNEFIKQYHQEYGAVGWSDCPVVQMDGNSSAAAANAAATTDQQREKLFRRHNLQRVDMKEPERMVRDMRLHLIEKEERRRQELMAREIQELGACTFRPAIDESMLGFERMQRESSPVVVRGLGRHMELRYLTEKKKQDEKRREEEVFTVQKVDRYRRAIDGSTIVQSFSLLGSAADRGVESSRTTVAANNHNNTSSSSNIYISSSSSNNRSSSSSYGCPELQLDYLTQPTSHRMQNASRSSAVAWVL